MKLHVTLQENNRSFSTKLIANDQSFNANFGQIQQLTKYIGGDVYEGDYNITPKIAPQTIPTKGKVMTDDVKINSIPFFNVSNTSGGSTVYIAREV